MIQHDASLEQGIPPGEKCCELPLREKSAAEQRLLLANKRRYNLGEQIDGNDDVKNFNALCRGEILLNHQVLARLKCWHDRRQQPYFYLMPIKVEQNSINPPIYTFHRVISDNEIEILKSLSAPQVSVINSAIGRRFHRRFTLFLLFLRKMKRSTVVESCDL